ncbi:hypothetical protein MIND_00908800 [Mycena indigotica]|uniref:F-box domain-containing protein n=1 Tax=Mycena indigotica TaxID=2126181 RepID=A0A8H6SC25_9AGAR|nr:uncharacterized protein MIND_00908800 [Mycena indigotica]KAF7296780.1 hypothetical protein MIND_00908800 [Mycena indigotica]
MHVALQSEAILGLLCTELRLSGTQADRHGLASLAQTCRSFAEPALDALWFTQPDIANAFKLFPEDLLEYEPLDDGGFFLHFRRPIRAEDLLHIYNYTRRIHELTFPPYNKSGYQGLAPTQYVHLAMASMFLYQIELFPNLTELSWESDDAWNVHNVGSDGPFLFFQQTVAYHAPCLTRLRLWTNFRWNLEFILPVASTLQMLALEYCSTYPCYQQVNPVALKLSDIQVLSIGNLDDAALSHIAHLLSLTELTLALPGQGIPPDSGYLSERTLPFKTLRVLNLCVVPGELRAPQTARGLDALLYFIRACDTLTLSSFTLDIQESGASGVTEVFIALSQRCSVTQLTQISCGLDSFDKALFEPHLPSLVYPLLHYPNLRQLQIEIGFGLTINDALLERLVHALPCLEELSLAKNIPYREQKAISLPHPSLTVDLYIFPYHDPRSLVTLGGLTAISQHSLRLRELRLSLDASKLESLAGGQAQVPAGGCPLRVFHAADSRIAAPWPAVWFLAKAFPELESVAYNNVERTAENRLGEASPDRPDAYERALVGYGKVWQQVNDALPDVRNSLGEKPNSSHEELAEILSGLRNLAMI